MRELTELAELRTGEPGSAISGMPHAECLAVAQLVRVTHQSQVLRADLSWTPAPGNAELEPEHVAFQLDLNLDARSTNHAHADFWSEIKEGQSAGGPRYSINVPGGRNIWLYKHGAPGRELGSIDGCGSAEIRALLLEAAEEFGSRLGDDHVARIAG